MACRASSPAVAGAGLIMAWPLQVQRRAHAWLWHGAGFPGMALAAGPVAGAGLRHGFGFDGRCRVHHGHGCSGRWRSHAGHGCSCTTNNRFRAQAQEALRQVLQGSWRAWWW